MLVSHLDSALSRIGKTVLHLDKRSQYGGPDGSYSINDLLELLEEQKNLTIGKVHLPAHTDLQIPLFAMANLKSQSQVYLSSQTLLQMTYLSSQTLLQEDFLSKSPANSVLTLHPS